MGVVLSHPSEEGYRVSSSVTAVNGAGQPMDVNMPKLLKHRQSAEAKKKMEHQKYLAKESPEPTYDLSQCELPEVPAGTYSLCKVLLKEVLILNDNYLSCLSGGGSVKDLMSIRVLDIHKNEITEIPEEICELCNLQVLNMESNKLKKLPKGLGRLQALQTLNVRGNSLKELPDSMCEMKSLRTLDIGNNKIKVLPGRLCEIRTLETINLDGKDMKYPPANTCLLGTESIMKFLCSECNLEYTPPSQHVLNVLAAPTLGAPNKNLEADRVKLDAMSTSVMNYEKIKEQKRLERQKLERDLAALDIEHAKIVAKSNMDRGRLLESLAKDQEKMDTGIKSLQARSDTEKKRLVASLYDVEQRASNLVSQLLTMNEAARKKEALLDKMEKERMEMDDYFKIVAEEHDHLRENDIIKSMKITLQSNFDLEDLRQRYEANKDTILRKAQQSEVEAFEKLDMQLNTQQINKDTLVSKLMQDEVFQRDAFEILFQAKDAKHKRLTDEIFMVQQQLAELTMMEIQKKSLKAENENIALEQKRSDLAGLLKQLMFERDDREQELKKRLEEMEKKRVEDEQDYWLIQYQRLLDRKPESLIDQENQLEFAVCDILTSAGAEDYIPKFARHRVSIETMVQMTDEDLREMGIHELGLRRAIISSIDDYLESQRRAVAKAAELEKPYESPYEKPYEKPYEGGPSAPPLAYDDKKWEEAGASAPPVEAGASMYQPVKEDVTVRVNAECVVCLERASDSLFLNCGHVCCCQVCAEPLFKCPLCRADIISKINMAQFQQVPVA
ncbi:E3 ubiquitin-protein ligase LRSAM1-like isoform X2 [Amphiura filiformis]|uniref:E3 ubiquitin-protein ligase LRSAM1-like isoform X2 n=1 Tax=Amphiura filiformis TaxID=82378 RepID=UPI003B20F07D